MIGLQRSKCRFGLIFQRKPLHSHVKIPLGIGQGFLFQPLTEVLLPARLDVTSDGAVNQSAAVPFGRDPVSTVTVVVGRITVMRS